MKSKLLNKLNDFINRTPKWKMFLILIPFYFVIFYLVLYAIFYLDSENPNLLTTQELLGTFLIVFTLVLSILMAFVVSSSFDSGKKSDNFWILAKDFEKLINDTTSKKELEKLYENEFEELRKMVQGRNHNIELYRLKSMMDIKYNFVN